MTLAPARLYARGFALTSSPMRHLDEVPHLVRHDVADRLLYVDEIVDLDQASEGVRHVAVVGTAWPLSTGQIAPNCESVARALVEILAERGLTGVEDALYDLGGRYAVVVVDGASTTIFHDATGNRSVYYNRDTGTVASHLDMLVRALPGTTGAGPGKYPSPDAMWDRTPFPDVRALLPNHRLDVAAREVTRYFPLTENRAHDLTGTQRYRLIERLWDEQLLRMVERGVPLVMSISGGVDSRTLLALAEPWKDRFHSVTYTSQGAVRGAVPTTAWEEVMDMDHHVVGQLRAHLPQQHTLIPREPSQWVSTNADTLHRNSPFSHGRWILPGYLAVAPGLNGIHYRGNLMELGKLVYGSPRQGEGPAEYLFRIGQPKTRAAGTSDEDALADAQRQWRSLGYDTLPSTYRMADLRYWEVRLGRWYAELLNETDTVFDSPNPANARRVLDAFLAFPDELRAQAGVHRELMRRNCPDLLAYGINAKTPGTRN